MARTRSEIYDSLITEKETMANLTALAPDPDSAQTLLNDLTTTSKVGEWRLMLWVTACGIYLHELLFDKHQTDVQALSEVLIVGTAKWLHARCLEYQFGDPLIWLNDRYQYSTIDLSKRIIARCAVVNLPNENKVRIKAVKVVSGAIEELDNIELSGFNAYIQNIVPVGTYVLTTSANPDELIVYATIYFNPQVIAPDGSLLSNSATFPVEDAINDYITNLPFNGIFNLNALIDSVQAVEGVNDIVLGTVSARYGALPFSTITQNYIPDAGYLEIAGGYDLNTTLTYIADV